MRPPILALVLLTASLGCASTGVGSRAREGPTSSGHGYALLHGILGQERHVSKLLVIKEERQALETVIDAIAETCGTAYERLEELAEASPRLDLSDDGLPVEEVRTRQAIAATRRDQLLAASGREFERQLLWAQNEALTYASHLADTLARSEPDPARLAFVRALWKDLTRHQQDVQALLRRPGSGGVNLPSASQPLAHLPTRYEDRGPSTPNAESNQSTTAITTTMFRMFLIFASIGM